MKLRRVGVTLLTLIGVILLVVSLALLAKTTQNSQEFGRLQLLILGINGVGVLVMLILILGSLFRLGREYRMHKAGARLKARLVGLFAGLALVPVLVVYGFSLQFLTRGIDSWFNLEVERGLDEALSVSRTAMEIRMREYLGRTREVAQALQGLEMAALIAELGYQQRETDAREITVFGPNSRIVAVSSEQIGTVPSTLPDEVLLQVRQGRPYVGLEPQRAGRLQVRTAAPIQVDSPIDEPRIVQALFPVNERLGYLAESVQAARNEYTKLAYLRTPLKFSFVLTLTLVLLLSLLAAVWGAIVSARRVVAPIQDLVAGTRAVAAGDFSTQLPVPTRDEIGFLVNSFNDMTRQLARAEAQAQASQQAVESERASLGAILAGLSTGVIALEPNLDVRVANSAAQNILGAPLTAGYALEHLGKASPMLAQLAHICRTRLGSGQGTAQGAGHSGAQSAGQSKAGRVGGPTTIEVGAGAITQWREQIALRGEVGRRVLMCACTSLPGEDGTVGGYILVFDDVTGLVQAQRDAAWGEVARRLAHEIKNPLTPIQLSAERMRHRYLKEMDPEKADLLNRSTHTIIQQVEAMKAMVDAFRDYARAPELNISKVDINRMVGEVSDLYRMRDADTRIELKLDEQLQTIEADAVRLRQLLNNLLTNAVEAASPGGKVALQIDTWLDATGESAKAQILVQDNGPGFNVETLGQIFEPYVTSKSKGTGLGLAIVKKIVEEHAGTIEVGNRTTGGAWVKIRIPVRDAERHLDSTPLATVVPIVEQPNAAPGGGSPRVQPVSVE